MAMTIHDRLCIGLEAMGATKMPKKNKYTMYELITETGDVVFYFVGKGGALRRSRWASVATTVSCNDRIKERIFAALANQLNV